MNVTLMKGKKMDAVIENLSRFLASTYVLYVKTQNFHWNVRGPRFHALHTLFEEQYRDLQDAVDTIAERIRALNHLSPGSMSEMLKLSQLSEAESSLTEDEMLSELAKDHETISRFLTEQIPLAQKEKDEGTADIYIERLRVHDKAAWMLRSHLERP